LTCSALPVSIREIAPVWGRILAQRDGSPVFLTPEWQQVWWDQFGGDPKDLRLVVIGDDENPLGIAPMLLSGDTLTFLGDTDLFDYHDFVLQEKDAAAFYPALVECLNAEPWRAMELVSLVESSPTLEHLPKLYERLGYSVAVDQEDVVPGVQLPATWDEYLARLRKKDRHELRRKLRRLDDYGDYSVVEASGGDLTEALASFLSLMEESKEEKRAFLTPEREAFFGRMATAMNEAGYLRLFFLELNGERVAGSLCFDYGGRRFLYNSGYRLAYGAYSVGLLLKALCIRQAIEEGLSYFDFLRGPEQYKHHLGGQPLNLYRLTVRR
jgi:CelD/BcsL family acetyltransferase involved in cellulose biosynthesis